MAEIKIGERLIGDGHPPYIIAEVGVNHNGIPQLAFELIDIAVDAGADAVKFQKRNLNTLYPKKYLDNVNAGEKSLRYLLPILQKVELPESTYHEIVEYCKKKGITFLCSPFDRESADFLETLGVPAFKVASADLSRKRNPSFCRLACPGLMRWNSQLNFSKSALCNLPCCTATAPILPLLKISICVIWINCANTMCR